MTDKQTDRRTDSLRQNSPRYAWHRAVKMVVRTDMPDVSKIHKKTLADTSDLGSRASVISLTSCNNSAKNSNIYG